MKAFIFGLSLFYSCVSFAHPHPHHHHHHHHHYHGQPYAMPYHQPLPQCPHVKRPIQRKFYPRGYYHHSCPHRPHMRRYYYRPQVILVPQPYMAAPHIGFYLNIPVH